MTAKRVSLYCVSVFGALSLMHLLAYTLGSWGPAVPSLRAQGMLVFFALAVMAGFLLLARRQDMLPDAEPWPLTWLLQPAVMLWIGILAALGVCMHVASKLYFLAQSDVDCLAQVRFVWLNRARDGNPLWVEVSSKLGHLFSSLVYAGCFVSAYALPARKPEFSRTACFRALGFFSLAVLYATIIVSRSTLVLFLMIGAAGLILGLSREGLDARRVRAILLVGGVAVGVVVLISLARFESTLSCIHSMDREEALGVEQRGFNSILPMRSRLNPSINPYWHVKTVPSGQELTDIPSLLLQRVRIFVEDSCATCSMAYIYLNHGIWNFEWIVESPGRGGSVLLKPFYGWAGVDPPHDANAQRPYGAGGATLPGAAYHDLGLVGPGIVAILLPVLLGLSVAWLRSPGPRAALGLLAYVGVFVVLNWSFIFHGWSVMAFPFVMLGMAAPFAAYAVQQWWRTRGGYVDHE